MLGIRLFPIVSVAIVAIVLLVYFLHPVSNMIFGDLGYFKDGRNNSFPPTLPFDKFLIQTRIFPSLMQIGYPRLFFMFVLNF